MRLPTHNMWQERPRTDKPDVKAHEIKLYLGNRGRRETFAMNHSTGGFMLLGPIVPVENETCEQEEQRRKSAQYFVSALFGASCK